jgi:CRISPR-associated protein Csx10
MIRRWFRIDLLNEAIFSVSSATAGGHGTLDYVPGAALLGAVARHYGSFGDRTWDVFHSGRVQFGNGYPLIGDAPTVPVPFCWHRPKAVDATVGGRIVSAQVFNLLIDDDRPDGVQPEQVRHGYVARNGAFIRPDASYRQRTAVDRFRLGRPREAALFGYSSVDAGQSFWFELRCPAGMPDAASRIEELLTGLPVVLGRSRNAEYGEVRVTALDDGFGARVDDVLAPRTSAGSGSIAFYALSDLAAEGTGGMPEGEELGLPGGWKIAADRCFVRTRCYAPFNGTRRAFDGDRTVIEKGSVLVYAGTGLVDPAAVRAALEGGVGLWRAEGLGRLLCAPWLLGKVRDCVPQAAGVVNRDKPEAPRPRDELAVWLSRRRTARTLPSVARDLADRWEEHFATLYRAVWKEARSEGRAPNDVAPLRAQWGTVREAALGVTDLAVLDRVLFAELPRDATGRIIKSQGSQSGGLLTTGAAAKGWGSEHWQDPVSQATAQTNFAGLLRRMISKEVLNAALKEAGLAGEGADLCGDLAAAVLVALAERMPRRLYRLERQPGTAPEGASK